MRRLAIALALVALAATPALACKPAPTRTAPAPTPPPTYQATAPDDGPEIDTQAIWGPVNRAPVNPWSDSDSARFDRMLDHVAALVETIAPHKDGVEDAENAGGRYLLQRRTSAAALTAEVKYLAARLQESAGSFQAYMMKRMGRLQRLSEDLAKLTPDQSRALGNIFRIE